MATSGCAVTLRYFWRLVVWVKRRCVPSHSNHIGLTCTVPSGLVVARWPNNGLVHRASYPSGTATTVDPLGSATTHGNVMALPWHPRMTFSVTGESLSAPTSPWTPRVATQLAVLAAAAFIYVTAEMLPVGALPAIATDLRDSEGLVATLMASYALVAALTTVAMVRLTARWPRRRTLVATLVCLTVSQVISALAPNFAVLAGGRVLCALAHGLMWSVIAPIGARLVPASHAGRATAAVYVGTG